MIREHALGEALALKAFERLAHYEVHLDRKLERTLAMLLRLKDLRREVLPGSSVSQIWYLPVMNRSSTEGRTLKSYLGPLRPPE